MECFSFEQLLAACEDAELPESIRRHVSGDACEVCAGRLEVARRLVALLPFLALEEVPKRVLEEALDIPARAHSPRPLVLELVRQGPLVAPAFRSTSSTTSRAIYRNGPYELDLAPMEDGSVMGEITCLAGSAPGEGAACTLHGESGNAHAELDSEGCFRFERVMPGRYVLVIDDGGTLLVLRDLEIAF